MSHDSNRPTIEAMARPAGSGFEALDAPLVKEMRDLIGARKASCPTDAARQIAGKARGASPEAIIDRLVRVYARFFPVFPGGGDAAESDSVAPMHTATAAPDPAITALQAHVADLQAERDGLREIIHWQQATLERQQTAIEQLAGGLDDAEARQDDLEAAMACTEADRAAAGIGETRH